MKQIQIRMQTHFQNPKIMKANFCNGILLLHKSPGMTSNKALQIVKKLYNAKKAGHTGSLDPLATGMLPICFGEATKFSQFLLDSDKCYIAEGLLGVTTTTQDSDGEVINTCKSNITHDALLETLKKFTGEITQLPSMYSAIKFKGKPLYKYARVGMEVDRKPRTIYIKELELLSFDEQRFTIRVVCTKGTYIRNLVEDIGNALGVGAHVTKLHRVYLKDFENLPMYTLDELSQLDLQDLQDLLLDMDKAIEHLPKLILNLEQIVSLHQGQKIQITTNRSNEGFIRIYGADNRFYGLGCANNDELTAVKMLSGAYMANSF